ncbi:NADP-dependent oxidoreductase domain-containing protein [Mycena sanguinolenta]|nr:NADP-dependent oxidoreductase domain-containing protein [Mycena sanguinolenta]
MVALRPEYVRKATESSLKKLGVDYIGLYYFHHADVHTPIELLPWQNSSISADTHPIAAVQVEYSPFTLDIEGPKIGLLAAAREPGVKIVVYAPLWLGQYVRSPVKSVSNSVLQKSPDDFEEGDFRKRVPRYSAEDFPNILRPQIYRRETEDIIPMPGTKKIKYLEENIAAGKLKLSVQDVQAVRDVAAQANAAQGDRCPGVMMSSLFAGTPPL